MGLTVPAQPLQGSPRSLKPHFSSSAPGWDSGGCSWLSWPAPCHAKPHGKPPALQVLRECLSLGKDDRDQGPRSISQTRLKYFFQFHFISICKFRKNPWEAKIVCLTVGLSLYLTQMCCVSPFLGLLTFSSLRMKDERFPKIYSTGFGMSWFSLFLAGSL